MANATRRTSDPFIRRSTLSFLTRGETRAVQCVAAQLHFGMVRAMRENKLDHIRATWKEVADWSGVSYSSVKRAVLRLRDLGWLKELPGHRIVFDYRRTCPFEKAQIEPRPNIELETFQDGCTHPIEPSSPECLGPSPSGADGLAEQREGGLKKKKPLLNPDQREALSILTAVPGIDRSGAVKAVKSGGSNLVDRVRQIVAAVSAMPSKPRKPGGLIVAAVCRPELGRKLIRDHSSKPQFKASSLPPPSKIHPVSTPVLNRWDTMRRSVSSWLEIADLCDPDDLDWIVSEASRHGWSRDELSVIPELRGVSL